MEFTRSSENQERLIRDLQDELVRGQSVKDNLRQKLKEVEDAFNDVEGRKQKISIERDNIIIERNNAIQEADQFRDDVEYLTKEVSQLLEDFKFETKEKNKLKQELLDLQAQNRQLQLKYQEDHGNIQETRYQLN